MTDQGLLQLLTAIGPQATFVVVVGFVIRYLYHQVLAAKQEVIALQEKRVQDAQAFTTQLLAVADAKHRQIEIVTAAMNESTNASREMRSAVETLLTDRGIHARFPSAPRRGA